MILPGSHPLVAPSQSLLPSRWPRGERAALEFSCQDLSTHLLLQVLVTLLGPFRTFWQRAVKPGCWVTSLTRSDHLLAVGGASFGGTSGALPSPTSSMGWPPSCSRVDLESDRLCLVSLLNEGKEIPTSICYEACKGLLAQC